MSVTFLRTKLQRATVTAARPASVGSLSLDRTLCCAAGLRSSELVDVHDLTNGARFTTRVVYGRSGQVQINGAESRLVRTGDRVMVAAYAELSPEEAAGHAPRVVLLGDRNAIQSIDENPGSPS
jgi:aspartate 1-decarboxylase